MISTCAKCGQKPQVWRMRGDGYSFGCPQVWCHNVTESYRSTRSALKGWNTKQEKLSKLIKGKQT